MTEPSAPAPVREAASATRWSLLPGLLSGIAVPLMLLLVWDHLPSWGELPSQEPGGARFKMSADVVFRRDPLGPAPTAHPRITNVQIVDYDGDGSSDVVATDAGRHALLLYRMSGGAWVESVIADDLGAPAHATLADIDGDGDTDILISLLGNLLPDDRRIGRLLLLEATGEGYKRHVLLDDVHRVADAQPGDFDGDGDLDIAVAAFGYSRGHVLWLENRGELAFREHVLHSAPGTIHVPVADYDGDGDPDIAAIVTQDEEELWAFESLGEGRFQSRLLHRWHNYDLGGAGLVKADLDSDGDMDLIVPVGDNLEDHTPYPQPYHGCFWFENEGGWKFTGRRIAEFGGTYAAAVADFNGDGHQDVVLVSMANDWSQPDNPSIIWLENDGRQAFQPWQIDTFPSHLVTVACGDLNGDGRADVVGGGLHLRAPYNRIGRVTAWINRGSGP